MPEITRDGSMDDLLPRVAEEAGDFGREAGDHIRLFRSTVPRHVQSAEDQEPLILAVLWQGKQVQRHRPCKLSVLPV